ncbi:MAG: class II aldolase/adducin family protein [Pseudomonadota bacterium]
MSEPTQQELREQLTHQYQHVERIGLNELASGNLSCRFDDGMLISPSGATADTITPSSIVHTTFEGIYAGDHKPSSEWRMHADIYTAIPEAKALVHTHSDYVVALACQLKPLPGFHYLVGEFGGSDVPCIPYATFGSHALAEWAAGALKDRTACLLGNHGMISRGADLATAVMLAHRLEIMCKQYLLSCQFGEPRLLTDEEWEDFFDKAKDYNYGIQEA